MSETCRGHGQAVAGKKFKQAFPCGNAGGASAEQDEAVGTLPGEVFVQTVWDVTVQLLNNPLILGFTVAAGLLL